MTFSTLLLGHSAAEFSAGFHALVISIDVIEIFFNVCER